MITLRRMLVFGRFNCDVYTHVTCIYANVKVEDPIFIQRGLRRMTEVAILNGYSPFIYGIS